MDEMIELFDVKNVHSSAAAINPEKLQWLNQHYIKSSDPAHIAHHLSYHLGRLGIDPTRGPDIAEVVTAQRERAKTLVEMAQNSVFFYREPDAYDKKAAAKHLRKEIAPALESLCRALEGLTQWTPPMLHTAVEHTAKSHGLDFGKLAQPVRVALSGRAVSPPIDVSLHLVGREQSVPRIRRAAAYAAQAG